MKIIKIILISSLIIFSSCGYKIINNISDSKFKIVSTEYKGDKKINRLLDSNFKRFYDNENATKFFKIKIDSQSIKKVTSKNVEGKDSGYSLEVIVIVEVYENKELSNDFQINKKINYNNLDSQFELKQYEKNITNDLVNLIITDINNYLLSIR